MEELKPKGNTPTYEAVSFEADMRGFWDAIGYSEAVNVNPAEQAKENKAFMLPPPNITGHLHLGHALDLSLIDSQARFYSMMGMSVLCVPGTDHAGIATQAKVISVLRDRGEDVDSWSREQLVEAAHQWKKEQEARIKQQINSLGVACDWGSYTFTLDKEYRNAVACAFKRLFDAGRIYKGVYLINWDTILQTAISDEEVEYVTKDDGKLWFVKYYFEGGEDFLVVATTRIETIFVDIALAVHPEDARYSSFIGQKVCNPLTGELIPVIADTRVESDFGTGVLKITPSHDKADFDIASDAALLDHSKCAISLSGLMNENAMFCIGQTVNEARICVEEFLIEHDLLDKVEAYQLRLAISSRSKGVIEMLPSEQWFVSMTGFGKQLVEAVSQQKLKLSPDTWHDTYMHWANNLKDWCISRQLWWGHRIPIWYSKKTGEMICSDTESPPESIRHELDEWEQDSSVLDTWFSSAIWPLAILGWPVRQELLERFYPVHAVITGYDIMFFWMIRMVMMCSFLCGKIPFPHACLHGLLYGKSFWRIDTQGMVRYVSGEERSKFMAMNQEDLPLDVFSKWEKLSKSKGNAIDPMDIIEKFGADVLRYSLLSSPVLGQQIDIDERKLDDGKRLLTKIWNAFRYVTSLCDTLSDTEQKDMLSKEKSELGICEKGILAKVEQSFANYTNNMRAFEADKALKDTVSLLWDDICADYLEITKVIMKTGSFNAQISTCRVLLNVFVCVIKMLHPFMPYITEKIYQSLRSMSVIHVVPSNHDDVLYTSFRSKDGMSYAWDDPYCKHSIFNICRLVDSDINLCIKDYETVLSIVQAIRSIKAELKCSSKKELSLHILKETMLSSHQNLVNSHLELICMLSQVESLQIKDAMVAPGIIRDVEGMKIFAYMPDDLLSATREKIDVRLSKLYTHKSKLCELLSEQDFVNRAPRDVLGGKKNQLKSVEEEISILEMELQKMEQKT